MPDKKSASFRELFLRNRRGLLHYLRRRVGREDASDLLQETFARALRRDEFEAVVDPPAFLKQIAINLAHDFARRRKTEAAYIRFDDYVIEAPSKGAPPEERLEYERRSRLLAGAVERLPPRCREVFRLHIYEDVSLREAARRLEISERMARKHLSLALQACRTALQQHPE